MATMSALEAAVLGELVQARVALLQLRALNGCRHYHDAMRFIAQAAERMGVTPGQLHELTLMAQTEGRA